MVEKDFSRRNFMQSTVAGAAAVGIGLPRNARGANDKVTLAWIGLGGRGSYLLRRAMTIEHVEVVAACDLIVGKAEKAAAVVKDERDKDINVYTDFRKMLAKEKLDGVVVATEVANHGEVVIPVLEAGLHCFSEKPMDATIEMVDAITLAARKAKGIYQIGFQRRADVGMRAGIELIHGGAIGEVNFMQGQWHWGGSGRGGGWVGNVDVSGGKLHEQACHHMDLMSWAMGNVAPTQCLAVGAISVDYEKIARHQAENLSSVSWWFPNGAIFSYTHLHGLVAPDFQGEKSWVMGKGGDLDLLNGFIYPRGGEKRAVSDEKPGWGDSSVRNELLEFADCCRTGKTPTGNHETGRVSSLMTLMAEKAMYRRDQNNYGPGMITWDEVGSTS